MSLWTHYRYLWNSVHSSQPIARFCLTQQYTHYTHIILKLLTGNQWPEQYEKQHRFSLPSDKAECAI